MMMMPASIFYFRTAAYRKLLKSFDIRYVNNSKFGMTAPKAFEKMKKTLWKMILNRLCPYELEVMTAILTGMK
jgi:hypothetical protein